MSSTPITTTPQDQGAPAPAAPRISAGWIVGALFAASFAIGVVAYARYVSSEKALTADLAAIADKGKALSVEQCVDEVLAWHARCEAMKSLCDLSIPRMMFECLKAQDRAPYCDGLTRTTEETTFGVAECKARGAYSERTTRNVCATAYRSIDAHCRESLKARGK